MRPIDKHYFKYREKNIVISIIIKLEDLLRWYEPIGKYQKRSISHHCLTFSNCFGLFCSEFSLF